MNTKTVYSLVGEDVFGGCILACISISQDKAREFIKKEYGLEFSETKGGRTNNKYLNITDNRDISLMSESVIEL